MSSMVRLGFISHLLTGIWFLVIRLGLWDPNYDSIFPFFGPAFLLIGFSYLVVSLFFLLEITTGLKLSVILSILFLGVSISWSVSVTQAWPSFIFIPLQVLSSLLSVTSIREISRRRKSGMSLLDLPVFG